MKKLLLLIMCMCISTTALAVDKFSSEYLKNKKHFAVMNPLTEGIVERSIKSALKKEIGVNCKVKFEGYTFSSMKKGIFKHLEIEGKDLVSNEIPIPYLHLKTLTDYNYIDYTQNPIEYKSDMTFAYDLILSDESMNKALKDKNYEKVLNTINNIAYPMFEVKGVSTKLLNNKIYVLTEYNFPISPSSKNKVFVVSSDIKAENGKIRAVNIHLDSAYGNISLHKVANLLNLLNPLEFTLKLLNEKQCNANIENVKIIDNKVQIDGKIFVKGD